MYQTKNDLSEELRTAIIELLNNRLADAVDLKTQIKQAHWNVKGPNFFALHELFDLIAKKVEKYADLVAERIMQLGGVSKGTARVAAGKSTLKEYPLEISDGADHVEALSSALARFGAEVRQAIDRTDRAGDQDTADILIQISRGIDKYLWFVEAHLQGRAAEAGSEPRKGAVKGRG